ncbi:UDP-N-acetylglucosamine 2-epimerase [Methylobacterium crusticola]|uniref:UDP-N-acetylglucosamine 2-epimerase (non-hydrolyzing) n=1 Tax=Methylobacterium crusticola TaxID=1697972 RepID=A0ABQ4QQA9_9HYPH|nr:UDP-N-acetylglucosamine 2-epimerase (non-hydrolyzing) [Methylobacterium crusticola]GJD47478.1 UDP-N-acetylglucosamine 2-epimerase [Methylobacterium crusticola]
MKILSVFGTRPEAIKMAPVIATLRETPGVTSRVCVTGQHRGMLDSVLATFAIRPDDDLALMRPDQTLSDVFAGVMTGLDGILAEWRPDYVLVQGDTATSTAAGMAAFFRRIAVGHVEAGLRTGNLASPWPEEANRRVTAVLAERHYAPTQRARAALLMEGIAADRILVTGNTGIDALLRTAEAVAVPGATRSRLEAAFGWLEAGARTILVTGHRRESFGSGFESICEALARIAGRPGVQVVYPVHPNPNVRGPVHARLGGIPGIRLIEPLDYPEFVYLMTRASLILTDSGGVQEEAPVLRKPVLVMRDTSERAEAVEAGVARLVGTDPATIVSAVHRLLDDSATYAAMASGASPFGDGHASDRIVADLVAHAGAPMPVRLRPLIPREFADPARAARGAQRIA